jgi:hypothetical protein
LLAVWNEREKIARKFHRYSIYKQAPIGSGWPKKVRDVNLKNITDNEKVSVAMALFKLLIFRRQYAVDRNKNCNASIRFHGFP